MLDTAERPTFTSPWLNTDEAAAYLGNSPKSLAIWRCQGQGPRYHILNRRLVRYHVDELDAFVRVGAERWPAGDTSLASGPDSSRQDSE